MNLTPFRHPVPATPFRLGLPFGQVAAGGTLSALQVRAPRKTIATIAAGWVSEDLLVREPGGNAAGAVRRAQADACPGHLNP